MNFDKNAESVKFLSNIVTSPITATTITPVSQINTVIPESNESYISKHVAAVSFLGSINTGVPESNPLPIELNDLPVEPKGVEAPQAIVNIPIEMYRQGEVVLPESFFGERLLLTIRGSPLVLFSVIPISEKYKPKRHRGPKTMFGL
jgi:hypothetical protein